jgi:hypothetical protein
LWGGAGHVTLPDAAFDAIARVVTKALDEARGHAQTPADTRLKRLLLEARQYVSDAFINDDMEVHKHSQSLLKDIDAELSDTSTDRSGK